MKTLKAKIKKTSVHYSKGTNKKGKSIWLSITDFNPRGERNYKIKVVKGIKNGFAEYQEIWFSPDEIILKHIDDGQLKLDLFSPQEHQENLHNPRYLNKRRFEVIIEGEKEYISAPDQETLKKVIRKKGIRNFKITQVSRLSKKELGE